MSRKRQILFLEDVPHPSGSTPYFAGDIYNGIYHGRQYQATVFQVWHDGYNQSVYEKDSGPDRCMLLPDDWDDKFLFSLAMKHGITIKKRYNRR